MHRYTPLPWRPVAPVQVVKDRAGEQRVLLEHDGHLISQDFRIISADVHTAHADASFIHIIEPADQVDQTALARTGASDDADGLAAFDVQVDIGKGVFAASVFV